MNLISTDIVQKPESQLLMLKPDDAEDQRSDQSTDAKYQEIFYHAGHIREACPNDPSKLKPMELQMALEKIMNLALADPTYTNKADAWMVLYNAKNFDSIDILRIGDDLWNLATPVFCDDSICRYKHIAQSDAKRLEDIIKMFFNGDDWQGMANFTFDFEMFKVEKSLRDQKFDSA